MNDNFANRAADWDSAEKIKMTEIFVNELNLHVKLQSNWKGLEIGAGTGLVGMQLAPFIHEIVYEDTSAAMLDILNQKLVNNTNSNILLGEVFDYKTQDIDFVFSCMAFHHIVDIENTINHLFSITNLGAIIVIGDLLTEDGSFHRFEPIPHKGFDLERLINQFENSGFEVQVAHIYNKLTRERVVGKLVDYEQFILVAKKII